MSFINIDFEKEIKQLRPVTWVYNNDPTESVNIGYIAEELDAIDAFKYLVQYDNNQPVGIKYELISVYAIEAIKVAYQKIEMLEKKIEQLTSEG
jgi:hypothetical protein